MSLIKTLVGSFVFAATAGLSLAAFHSPTASAAESPLAGVVTHVQGSASVDRSASSMALSVGQQVLIGDRVVTGRDARVGLKMTDGGVLRLGADTVFVIEDYSYSEQAGKGRARIFLLKGAMRLITGAIAKLQERDFKLETVVAMTGVRGTDFWAGFYFSDALDVALFDGAGVHVENAAGRVEIARAGDGTTVKGPDLPPSAPIRWGREKYDAAVQSVAWDGGDGPGR
jgi:hypothetical protein